MTGGVAGVWESAGKAKDVATTRDAIFIGFISKARKYS
jgi:hypothetical protein